MPYGWLLCDGTIRHKNNYLELWNKLPNFFKDLENETFVIDLRNRTIMGANPDITGKADGNTSNVGDVQKAQLPNIKGDCILAGEYDLFAIRSDNSSNARPTNAKGMFKWQNDGGGRTYIGRGGSGYYNSSDIHLDASNTGSTFSASIDHLGNNVYYGDFNNNTEANRTFGEVRSANIRMNWIIKY